MRLTTKSKKLGHVKPPARFIRQAINISKSVDNLDRYDWEVETRPIIKSQSSMFATHLVCCYDADKHTDYDAMNLIWILSCDRNHRLGYMKYDQGLNTYGCSFDHDDYIDKPMRPGDIFWLDINNGHYLSTYDTLTTKMYVGFHIEIPLSILKEETFHDFQLITYMKYLVKRHLYGQ